MKRTITKNKDGTWKIVEENEVTMTAEQLLDARNKKIQNVLDTEGQIEVVLQQIEKARTDIVDMRKQIAELNASLKFPEGDMEKRGLDALK